MTKNSKAMKINVISKILFKHMNNFKSFGSIKKILFNDIGEGTTDGNIVQYFVKEGEKVNEDQPVVEISILKNTAKVQSPDNGIVKKIHFKTGDPIKVGQTLIEIETEGDYEDSTKVVSNIQNQSNTNNKNDTIDHNNTKIEKTESGRDIPYEKCEFYFI